MPRADRLRPSAQHLPAPRVGRTYGARLDVHPPRCRPARGASSCAPRPPATQIAALTDQLLERGDVVRLVSRDHANSDRSPVVHIGEACHTTAELLATEQHALETAWLIGRLALASSATTKLWSRLRGARASATTRPRRSTASRRCRLRRGDVRERPGLLDRQDHQGCRR